MRLVEEARIGGAELNDFDELEAGEEMDGEDVDHDDESLIELEDD